MAQLFYRRGVPHELGQVQIGKPPYVPFSNKSFWTQKLEPDHPLIIDSNNYPAKIAKQARYTKNTSPANGYDYPFGIAVNRTQYTVPLYVIPPGYPTRKIWVTRSGSASDTNDYGSATLTAGSNIMTNCTQPWVVGDVVVTDQERIEEYATVVSVTGTTVTLNKNALVTGTSQPLYKPMADSYASGLQGKMNAVPVPRMSDLPDWWHTSFGNQLWANGASGGTGSGDFEVVFWQPSTDKMWEFWKFQGGEAGGYTFDYGAVIENVSQSRGDIPNGWGAKACGLAAIGGMLTAQEYFDGGFHHMINVALPVTKNLHLAPATRHDSFSTLPSGSTVDAVPEGAIFRLPANITINPNWSPFLKMVVRAVRDYGLIVTDTAGVVQFQMDDPRCIGHMFSNTIRGTDWKYPPGPLLSNGTAQQARYDMNAFPWESLQQIKYVPIP